jgi:hypothetical protein
MGPKKVILRDLPIEGGDQARETFRANHEINFEFLHLLSSLYRAWATQFTSRHGASSTTLVQEKGEPTKLHLL